MSSAGSSSGSSSSSISEIKSESSGSTSTSNTCECKACTTYFKKPIPDKIDERLKMIVKMAIYEFAACVIYDPVKWKEGNGSRARFGSEMIYRFINILGKYSDELLERLSEWIPNHVPKLLSEKLDKLDIKDKNLPDFEFLALLGKTRNWKAGCAICITDEPTGTICACGETHTMVFRPCGHAVCVNPCFIKLLGPQSILFDEHNDRNIVTNFYCPYCREKVTYAFHAEKTLVKDFVIIDEKDILKLLS